MNKRVPWNKGLKGSEYLKHFKNEKVWNKGKKGYYQNKTATPKFLLAHDINWLTEQYYGFDLSTQEMADMLGCCKTNIQKNMRKFSIPLKTNTFYILLRNEQGRKKCLSCNRWLDENKFYIDKRSSDNLTKFCKRCVNELSIDYRQIDKIQVLFFYSKGTMKCKMCGEEDIDVLTIDHIYNDGGKHRKEINNDNINYWLRKHNFPEGYRVLCRNCNWRDMLHTRYSSLKR